MTKVTTPTLVNPFAKSGLHAVVELTDPNLIQFYAESVASQINDFRMSYAPQKRVIDLSYWIADIIVETSAQGASLLEVHIIDPAWTLFLRDKNGVCFIDVDDQGYLWPPIEVNFPKDTSDATWRLCQIRPSTSLTEANVILTFEDKIVSELREHAKQQVSSNNQTRAEFIQSLVNDVNKNPAYPGDVKIKFVPLLPHITFTQADLTLQEQVPLSGKQSNPPPARKDHKKKPVPQDAWTRNIPPTILQGAVQGIDIAIQNGWNAIVDSTGKTPGTTSANLPEPNLLQGLGG